MISKRLLRFNYGGLRRMNNRSGKLFLNASSRLETSKLALSTSNATSNTFPQLVGRCSEARGLHTLPAEDCSCTAEYQAASELGLEIDYSSSLANVITRHYRHVLIHTGKIDWPSKIETEENSAASILKPLISRGSVFVDPFYPILLSSSSLPPSNAAVGRGTVTLSIFPEAVEITSIPNDPAAFNSLIKSYFLHQSNPLFAERTDTTSVKTTNITKPVILTCSHGSRDQRCGILGPLITEAFETVLQKNEGLGRQDVIVGDISHIGGHKFAGNVIVHLPGHYELAKAINRAPVASMTTTSPTPSVQSPDHREDRSVSIWYGRIMPSHAETIIDYTLRNGKLVKNLLRGIVNSEGELVDMKAVGLI